MDKLFLVIQDIFTGTSCNQKTKWELWYFDIAIEIFTSIPLFCCSVQRFMTPSTAEHQAPLSSAISWNLLKFISIELVMLSNHFILCRPSSLFAFNLSQHQSFPISSYQEAKVLGLRLQHQSFQWLFRVDFL